MYSMRHGSPGSRPTLPGSRRRRHGGVHRARVPAHADGGRGRGHGRGQGHRVLLRREQGGAVRRGVAVRGCPAPDRCATHPSGSCACSWPDPPIRPGPSRRSARQPHAVERAYRTPGGGRRRGAREDRAGALSSHGQEPHWDQARGPLRRRIPGAGEGVVQRGARRAADPAHALPRRRHPPRASCAPSPTQAVAARLIIETLVFWAVHRHWDPSPQPVDSRLAEETVVQMLGSALVESERAAASDDGAVRQRTSCRSSPISPCATRRPAPSARGGFRWRPASCSRSGPVRVSTFRSMGRTSGSSTRSSLRTGSAGWPGPGAGRGGVRGRVPGRSRRDHPAGGCVGRHGGHDVDALHDRGSHPSARADPARPPPGRPADLR